MAQLVGGLYFVVPVTKFNPDAHVEIEHSQCDRIDLPLQALRFPPTYQRQAGCWENNILNCLQCADER